MDAARRRRLGRVLFLDSKKLRDYMKKDLSKARLNLIVLYHSGRDQFMLLEGHHSLSLINLALKNKTALPQEVFVDLGLIAEEHLNLFSQILDGEIPLTPWQDWEKRLR